MKPMISCKNACYSYGNTRVVKGVFFEIPKGEIFGLLGPNGAGKTTILSMLAGIKKPSSGKIVIQGLDMSNHLNEIKKNIGYVPQSFAFYPTLTGFENLKFFCGIYQIFGKTAEKRIHHVLEIVQLTDRKADVVDTYSGGMKRRLNIAIGLLHEPQILLLDEPTAGVDPHSRNSIFECIKHLSQTGTTVIYTTHYMEEMERLCQRVAILNQGQVIAMDSPKNLCALLGGGFFQFDVQGENKESLVEYLSQMDFTIEVSLKNSLLEVCSRELQKALHITFNASDRLGVQISSLRISKPSLETLFLKLTGKELRDNGGS
jgi:ABC-2 type transport system ATP-binding protein